MYSPPRIAAFVFEHDRLLGSCSLAPRPPSDGFPPAGAPLPEGAGCRARAQQGCRLQEHGWVDLCSKLRCFGHFLLRGSLSLLGFFWQQPSS